MKTVERREAWLLGGIVLLAIAVRFPTLGTQSFWNDEAVTRALVGRGLGHVLRTVPHTESTPPLYYVLVWAWARIFGLSEAGLRSFSALCGALTVPIVWAIGRKLIGERVALIAALLTALSPLLFWYSQEARAYALLVMLSATTLLALIYALERPSWLRLLGWGIVCALALSTHYFAMVVIVPEGVWLLRALYRGRALDAALVAAAMLPIVIAAGALTPLLVEQNSGAHLNWLASRAGSIPHRVLVLARDDVVGSQLPARVVLTALASAAVLVAVALLASRASIAERRGAALPLVVGVGGIALAVIASAVITDYANTRNLIATWPALALVVAAGFGSEALGRAGLAAAAALAAVGATCIVAVSADPKYQRPDWRGAARALGATTEPRALLAGHLSYLYDSLTPYLRGLVPYPRRAPAVRELDMITVSRQQWGGLATPPPLRLPASRLPGFPTVRRVSTDSYTVTRYLAPTPVRLRAASLAALDPGDELALQR